MNIQDVLKVLEQRGIAVNNHSGCEIILQDTANVIQYSHWRNGLDVWEYWIRERDAGILHFTNIAELEALLDKWYLPWPEVEKLYKRKNN